METKEAMAVLTDALRSDPEYYFGWQANIAVTFQDVFRAWYPGTASDLDIHGVSNEAAKRFLEMLTYKQPEND